MPEYSSTTITPSDGVQVPGMNGSTSGNFLLSALKSYILSEKGLANGLASLDGNGKLTASQLPDLADDVIVVSSYATLPATGTAGKIYITADTNKGYRWDPELTTPGYVKIFEIDKSIVFGYYSSGSFYEDSEHTVQITPVEHVLYVDVSLADIYVLNDGTLIELLGTKWAKITDIQDGTIQAGIAVKAFQDAMGRAIITTYATKAELSAEESSREAADSNLKSALTAVDHRVQNLEQAKGDYVAVDSDKGVITTPSGKGKWAVVEKLRGVSRARNNAIDGGVFTGTGRLDTASGSVTYDSNGITSVLPAGSYYEQAYRKSIASPIQKDHFFVFALVGSAISKRLYKNGTLIQSLSGANFGVAQAGDTVNEFRFGPSSISESTTYNWKYLKITDLNIYFGTSDLSFLGATDSAKLATIQTYYPWLLEPSDYGTRIVDSSYSGVRAWARNIFNPQGATADVSLSSSGGTYIQTGHSTSDYLPIKPNVQYYHKNTLASGSYIVLCYYDENKAFISAVATTNTTTTSPANAKYIRISYLTADVGQICVNKSDSQNGTYTPYHAPSTLSLSFQGKSAGAVADTCEPNVEVGGVAKRRDTQRVESVDLEQTDFTLYEGSDYWFFIGYVDNSKPAQSSASVVTEMTSRYRAVTTNAIGYADNTIALNSTTLRIRTDSKTNPPKGILNYALATESVTLSDPILDNTLLTEAGGRLSTVQTGTIVDGSFDMGFINL